MGGEILSALADSRVSLRGLLPVASRSTGVSQVEFGEESLSVLDLEDPRLETADLFLSALPFESSRTLLAEQLDSGKPLVDLSGSLGYDVPLVAHGVNLDDPARDRAARTLTAPRPEALVVATLLAALRAFPVTAVRGLAMVPASVAGRNGLEELSGQVVALFNSQEPPRVAFPGGLAFDVLPAWGAGASWSTLERLVAYQIAGLTGMEPAQVGLGVCVVPTFSGLSLSLHFSGAGASLESIEAALEAHPGLRLVKDTEGTPLKQLGLPTVAVGRLREDPAGDGIHLWATCDPLRVAAANAVALALGLWDETR
jgi:aspartate-semialdehyde dehydrogenase